MDVRVGRLVAAAAFAAALIASQTAFSQDGTFVSKEKKFSVTFPKDWEIKENFMGTTILALRPAAANDVFRENVNVVTEDIPKTMTVEEYFSASLDGLKKLLTDFAEIEKGESTINGRKLKWLTYRHRMGQLKLEVLVYCAVKDGRGYAITCSTVEGGLEKWRKPFEQIVGTFKVVD
jgi:hypothetical protein